MSWSVAMTGTRPECLQKLQDDPHIPERIKEALQAATAAFGEHVSLSVATHGHITQDAPGASDSALIEIRRV
jgi:hypothetical protein